MFTYELHRIFTILMIRKAVLIQFVRIAGLSGGKVG